MNKIIFQNLKSIKNEYANGTNLIKYINSILGSASGNSLDSILTSYDFQAGNYIKIVEENPAQSSKYCEMVADIINSLELESFSVMEVGCGELTTLSNVVNRLPKAKEIFGFDISLSRISKGKEYYNKVCGRPDNFFFVGDLFNIPFQDNSVDVVYTSHSVEPNGGRELEAIKELLRITNKYLVLLEPSYENASEEGQKRMSMHGYVKNLKQTIESLGYTLERYQKATICTNELNLTWIHVIKKNNTTFVADKIICPITKEKLVVGKDSVYSPNLISYPIVHGIPYLLETHAILSSKVGL